VLDPIAQAKAARTLRMTAARSPFDSAKGKWAYLHGTIKVAL